MQNNTGILITPECKTQSFAFLEKSRTYNLAYTKPITLADLTYNKLALQHRFLKKSRFRKIDKKNAVVNFMEK